MSRLLKMSFHINDLSSLHVDQSGMPYHVCTFTNTLSISQGNPQTPLQQTYSEIPNGDQAISANLAGAPLPYPGILAETPISSPPIRHSRPGSPRVLFLDFNGHVVTNTAWNLQTNTLWNPTPIRVARWDCRPFDIDGTTNTFSPEEQTCILQIWERVSEDYAPFDVDVTTEQPAIWTTHTAHALITQSNDVNGIACPHLGMGGTAYVNTFGESGFSYNDPSCYSPAFIMPMSGYNYANTAEATAHELGHNMGVNYHYGTSTNSYYGGHGTGETSWGPIMGTGFGRNVSQWSKGEYHDCNQAHADDLAILSAKAPYRIDDHGDTQSTSTQLTATHGMITASGIISSNTDVDVFSFTAVAGPICLTVFPYRCASGTYGGNLDIQARLFNSSGTLLTESNPPDSTRAYLTYTIPATDLYYLHISNTGAGNPTNGSPTGYTAYGSIGQYYITGQIAIATLTVQTPSGGEVWHKGQTNTILWTSGTNTFATAQIALYRNNSLYSILTHAVTNSGTYAWPMPPPLLSDTNFKIRVSSTSPTSLWAESDASFTIAGPSLLVLSENFDASPTLPAGWTRSILAGTNFWKFQNGGTTGGSHPLSAYSSPYNTCLYHEDYTTNICRLQTPPLPLGNCTGAVLQFQHYMERWDQDQDTLNILVKTNSTALWSKIASYTNSIDTWTQQIIPLPNPGTNYSIAFEGRANYGYGICLDDIEVYGYPLDINTATNNTPLSWLADHGLEPNDTGALGDTDADGMPAWAEWIAGTLPTQSTSRLSITNAWASDNNHIMRWSTATGRVYSVNWSSNLVTTPFSALITNNTSGIYTDSVHAVDLNSFYRISVQISP